MRTARRTAGPVTDRAGALRPLLVLGTGALLGSALVVAADTMGRIALAPAEIPAGIVTALIGTPYFLWLLWRSRRPAAVAL